MENEEKEKARAQREFRRIMAAQDQAERVANNVYHRLMAVGSSVLFVVVVAGLLFQLGRIYASREDACSC